MSDVSIHRWPQAALMGDLVRGTAATAVAAFFLVLVPVLSLAFIGLLFLTVLFGLYLAGTVSRWTSVVEVDDEGIRLSGGLFGRRNVTWAQLQRFELRHFPLSRDRTQGWMDLKLKGATSAMSIDDRLDRFGEVLARAWAAAQRAELGISDATHANLVAAGLIDKAGR